MRKMFPFDDVIMCTKFDMGLCICFHFYDLEVVYVDNLHRKII